MGVRIIPSKVFLFVDTSKNETQIVTLPDFQNAYDIKPLTILAKQDFTIELDSSSQLKKLTSNQDTTAIFTFLGSLAESAGKAAGTFASATLIKGTFGLATGVYEFKQDGTFAKYKYDSASETLIP